MKQWQLKNITSSLQQSCTLLHRTEGNRFYCLSPLEKEQSLKQWYVATMSGCTVNHFKRLTHSRMLPAAQEGDPFPTFLCLFISPLRYITLYCCVKRQTPVPFLLLSQDFNEIVRKKGCHLLTFELKIKPQKCNSYFSTRSILDYILMLII